MIIGLSILRCKLSCTFSSSRRGSAERNLNEITHYHCFGCDFGFKR